MVRVHFRIYQVRIQILGWIFQILIRMINLSVSASELTDADSHYEFLIF